MRPTPTFLRFTPNFPGLVSPIPVRPSLFFRHLLGSLAGVPTRLTPSRLFVSGLLITSCPDRWLSRVSAQIGCVRRSQPSAGSLRFSYPLILIPDQMTTHSPGTIFFSAVTMEQSTTSSRYSVRVGQTIIAALMSITR